CRDENGKLTFEKAAIYLKEENLQSLINKGIILTEYKDSIIKKALATVCFCPAKLSDGRWVVIAYINTSTLVSDVGNQCMIKYPFVDFCACFSIDPSEQTTNFSLRSTDQREDVSVIAKHHGGGGHRNA